MTVKDLLKCTIDHSWIGITFTLKYGNNTFILDKLEDEDLIETHGKYVSRVDLINYSSDIKSFLEDKL